MSSTIVVKIQNPTMGDLYEIPFDTISYTEELNGGKDCKLTCDYQALNVAAKAYGTTVVDIISSTYRELWIEMNGTKIWYGAVSELSMSKNATGEYKIDIYGVSFFSLFQKRFTSNLRSFSAVDAGTVAWTLINESQTADPPYSDFGITQGSVATSVPRTIDYNFQEIRQAIIDLSNANLADGFDFDIDNTKKFNVYYPYKGSVRPNLVLDNKNIFGWAVTKGLVTTLANKVYSIGQGVNQDVAYVYVSAAVGFRSAFKVLEATVSAKQVSDLTILTDQANQYLSFHQSPVWTLTITHHGDDPDITTYDVGDTLMLTIPELNLTLAQYRVKKRRIDIDENSVVTVNIDMQVI